jgi:hypothetical protein
MQRSSRETRLTSLMLPVAIPLCGPLWRQPRNTLDQGQESGCVAVTREAERIANRRVMSILREEGSTRFPCQNFSNCLEQCHLPDVSRSSTSSGEINPMSKEAEYRANAASAIELASHASNAIDKNRLLEMGEKWLDLADRAQRLVARFKPTGGSIPFYSPSWATKNTRMRNSARASGKAPRRPLLPHLNRGPLGRLACSTVWRRLISGPAAPARVGS